MSMIHKFEMFCRVDGGEDDTLLGELMTASEIQVMRRRAIAYAEECKGRRKARATALKAESDRLAKLAAEMDQ